SVSHQALDGFPAIAEQDIDVGGIDAVMFEDMLKLGHPLSPSAVIMTGQGCTAPPVPWQGHGASERERERAVDRDVTLRSGDASCSLSPVLGGEGAGPACHK